MRTRVALRGLQGIVYMRQLLNPLRYPITAFCLLSHKIVRYFGFLFLILALLANVWLASGSFFYQALLTLHLGGYGLALIGLARNLPRWLSRVTVIPAYVVLSYTAFAVAAFRFFRGDTMATWQPRAG